MLRFPSLRQQFTSRAFTASAVASMAFNSHSENCKEAVVRTRQEDANLTITLTIVGKTRILNRPKVEHLGRSLERLRLTLTNPKKKSRKRKEGAQVENGDEISAPNVALYTSESRELLMSEESSNEEAWKMGAYLIAGDAEYKVVVNPPTVEKLEMKDKIMVDHPIYPFCTLSFAQEELCHWSWFRQKTPNDSLVKLPVETRIFTPTNDDLGSYIHVQCIPVSSNITSSESSSHRYGEPYLLKIGRVEKGPRACSGDGRHYQTTQLTETPVFRMVSYNALAGAYTSRPNAVETIFDYCNPKFLDIDYRKQLILKEILGYQADIICLQEVDTKVFSTYLEPHMRSHGFEGMFTQKSINTREGSATFIRSSRFQLKKHCSLMLNKILENEIPPYLQPFQDMIACSENMQRALKAVGTIAQITIIEPVHANEKMLCVINTHLIARNFAEHIRLLHTVYILHKAKEMVMEFGEEAQILFAGDLNSSVENGVLDLSIQYLRDGFIKPDHWEWKDCSKFTWKKSLGGDDEEDDEHGITKKVDQEVVDPIKGINLDLPLILRSAMSLDTPWTNYTDLFKGLLDYIWYEPQYLKLDRVIPLPSEERLEGPVPSDIYPSDHLAIVAEFRFTTLDTTSVKPASLENVDLGVQALRQGAIIGVPTDTIYGLAADGSNPDAIGKLYSVKRRAHHVPLAVCVSHPSDISHLCDTDHLPPKLLESLLPGPVTPILTRKQTPKLSEELNPKLHTIAVRVPDCPFIRHICERLDGPIALTSANTSGNRSSTDISHFMHLWSECAWVFDGGEIPTSFLGSTMIDLTIPQSFKIVRRGDGLKKVLDVMQKWNLVERRDEH